ncbi:MAG: Crp/Fnr family transcriptional regulator [Anaerolineae bacterium]|jgi:CRP/FNR family transcriptional regulator, cyclic AMP receptor protein
MVSINTEELPLFAGLDDAERSALEACLHVRSYPGRVTIINEGDISHSLYLILEGSVKVYVSDEHGREVVLCTQGPGEYFGELALVDDAPRSASVITLAHTRLAILVREDLRRCVREHPDIALAMIQGLTGRVRRLTEQVRSLALHDVYGRLTELLTGLAEDRGGQPVIEPRPTHQELANRIGASREMVTRILGDLVRGGYLRMEGQRMTLLGKLPKKW